MNSEANRLLKALFDYARRRREGGVYDFTQIMHEYGKYVLPEFMENSKNALGKRFNTMIREYVATDPRYQSKLDAYGLKHKR